MPGHDIQGNFGPCHNIQAFFRAERGMADKLFMSEKGGILPGGTVYMDFNPCIQQRVNNLFPVIVHDTKAGLPQFKK